MNSQSSDRASSGVPDRRDAKLEKKAEGLYKNRRSDVNRRSASNMEGEGVAPAEPMIDGALKVAM
jgi:hypothetical protein